MHYRSGGDSGSSSSKTVCICTQCISFWWNVSLPIPRYTAQKVWHPWNIAEYKIFHHLRIMYYHCENFNHQKHPPTFQLFELGRKSLVCHMFRVIFAFLLFFVYKCANSISGSIIELLDHVESKQFTWFTWARRTLRSRDRLYYGNWCIVKRRLARISSLWTRANDESEQSNWIMTN